MKLNLWKFKCSLMIMISFFFFVNLSCTSKEEKKAEHAETARQYIEKNELKKAVIELKNVIQLDPEDAAGEPFGEERLVSAARSALDLPCADIVKRIHETITGFTGARLADDFTLVAVKVR